MTSKEEFTGFPSYPVSTEAKEHHRRSIFSTSVMRLDQVHVNLVHPESSPSKKLLEDDHSLRLIEDLSNRSIDPMFSDAKLIIKPVSRMQLWTVRIIVVILCAVIGSMGYIFVRNLQYDYRKKIRQYLISQIHTTKATVASLSQEIITLRQQVKQQSLPQHNAYDDEQDSQMSVLNGTTAIKGSGITIIIANPLIDQSLSTTKSTEQIKVITDIDLQQIVNLLWHLGAKAIAINGNRIGVQTSIRVAGQTILVGTTGIESPYQIEAIGDKNRLATGLDREHQPHVYNNFKKAGISFRVRKSNMISLAETIPSDITYAKRSTD